MGPVHHRGRDHSATSSRHPRLPVGDHLTDFAHAGLAQISGAEPFFEWFVFEHGNPPRTPAVLYTDENMGTQAGNSFQTNNLGNGSFYAAPGLYDLIPVVTPPGQNYFPTTVLVPVNPLDAGGASGQSVLFGIAGDVPGAAMASFVNEGLATMTPLPSLFDGAPLVYWQALQEQDGVILAGTIPSAASFIGHDLNLIYRSTDGGQTWIGISTPWDADIPGSPGTYIWAIAFGADGQVLLVGNNNTLVNAIVGWSTDGGLTWADITADTPLAGSGAQGGAATVAYDGTNWYLGVQTPVSGTGLWTSADPTTLESWTAQTTGLDGEIVNAVVTTPDVAIATGGAGTVDLVVSTDNGSTWVDNANPFDGVGAPEAIVTDGAGNWLAWGVDSIVQSLDNAATWGTPVPTAISEKASCFLLSVGWVTVWSFVDTDNGETIGTVIYSATVTDPLVIVPTGYVANNIYAPLALIPV
jgi:hypothetical protein